MSFDFATLQICPHRVEFDLSLLDSISMDRVKFPRPPSNSSVNLYIDGVEVPRGGLFSYAEVAFMKSEPYNIRSNENDLLYIKIGSDIPRIIQLIPGFNVKASDLARDLQRKIDQLEIYVSNNRVTFKSRSISNGVQFSFPDPRWTDRTSSLISTSRILLAFSTLGINPGRLLYGKQLFPSWSIITDPTSPLGIDKYVVFNSPILNHDPVIQLSYNTDRPYCRRCFGTQIEFDYSIKNNTYEIVDDADLLAQEFDKFLFTRIGSHWKWTWLGSGLIDRVGGKGNVAGAYASSMINIDISQTFKTYQNIKTQQESNFKFQDISDAEFPYSLGGIDMQTPDDDPTIVIVTTQIVSRSREPITLKRVIGNPNPFYLRGDPIQNMKYMVQGNTSFLLRG